MDILNVTGSVLQYLREKIIIGEFKPGQRLNEYNLSSELNISRPPLREAFRVLEQDRLVNYIPRKGSYVTDLSAKDFEEVSQVREMMECYAIDLIKAKVTKDINLENMEYSVYNSSQVPKSLNDIDQIQLTKYIKTILDFHYSLIEASGNSRLQAMYHSITYHLARYQFIYFKIDGAVWHSLEDHKQTFELIKNGHYNQAKEELRKHIRYTFEKVKNKVFASNSLYVASL